MTTVKYPTPLHERVLAEVLADLRADPNVRGVMLGGSLSRGTARRDSDLDVYAVTAEDDGDARWRRQDRLLPVDLLAYTAEVWRARFSPDRVGDESWGYAFLDGVVLSDPDGVVAQLRIDAAEIHASYRVPAHIRAHYAGLWEHLRPKMLAVLHRDDPTEIGWAAAVMTNEVVRTVWAANDLPNPSLDLGTFQRHLDDLTVPPDAPDRLRAILQAPRKQALRLQLDLLALVEPHLPLAP
ncbi:nucleotidyltransferase domain-containing protein [Nonomuraea sp. CA-141351]|uniref:nucleotidyltransferase domain-containing protein n=1 Tax=Nonomuraea sp. CA-141351 TaxID=3239996 RepID=UPI003D8AB44F